MPSHDKLPSLSDSKWAQNVLYIIMAGVNESCMDWLHEYSVCQLLYDSVSN